MNRRTFFSAAADGKFWKYDPVMIAALLRSFIVKA